MLRCSAHPHIVGSTAKTNCTPNSAVLCAPQVEQLRDENEALMVELVQKKMALAELSESYARVRRDLHRREAKDRAVSSKMSRMCVPNYQELYPLACSLHFVVGCDGLFSAAYHFHNVALPVYRCWCTQITIYGVWCCRHAILGSGDPSRMLRSSPSPSFNRERK